MEDGEYFRTLANNTVLLLLRQGERWYPAGVDVIKAGECVQVSLSVFSGLIFALFSYFSNPQDSL